MVDELMLRDVKNILSKIEVVRAREDFLELIKEFGVSIESSEEEIDEAIVAYMMSEKEVKLFRRYLLYKKKTDIVNLSKAIDSVSDITESVSDYYENRRKNNITISCIEDVKERINHGLREIPNIRVGTEYGKVKGSYRKYYDAYIKSGMDRYTFVEGIEQIEHSSSLVKRIRKGKLKKLKQGLDDFNVEAKSNIDDLYQRYLEAREDYRAYLIILMTDMMSKNKELYNAGLLALYSMFGIEVPVKVLDNGLVVVNESIEIDIHAKFIAEKAFEYFQKIDEPEFDADMFIKSFRAFLLHFYNQELIRLNEENNKSLRGIKDQFDKQKDVIGTISLLQSSLEIPSLEQEKDEEDTFALIYTDTRYNK